MDEKGEKVFTHKHKYNKYTINQKHMFLHIEGERHICLHVYLEPQGINRMHFSGDVVASLAKPGPSGAGSSSSWTAWAQASTGLTWVLPDPRLAWKPIEGHI